MLSPQEDFQKKDSKNDSESFIYEFIDQINKAKDPETDHIAVQRTVHDSVYLLLRLGYDSNTLSQLTGVSDSFLRESLCQIGLRTPPYPTATSDTVEPSQTDYSGTHSKFESFMETVQTVKEQSQNIGSQNLRTTQKQQLLPQLQHQNEYPVNQKAPSGKNWLSKSKVSLNDSDSDEEEEHLSKPPQTSQTIRQENSQTSTTNSTTPVTQLVYVPEFSIEEKKFQKVFKDRLRNLSDVDPLSRHGSLFIDETRSKLISDVNAFMDYVVLLKNREITKYNESQPTNPRQTHRKTGLTASPQSPKQEKLINDSFVKMTRVC